MNRPHFSCLSCGYIIAENQSWDVTHCEHGFIHANCVYFKKTCPTCEVILDTKDGNNSFHFEDANGMDEGTFGGEINSTLQVIAIKKSLSELEIDITQQLEDREVANKKISELETALKQKDKEIEELKTEIYRLKIEKIDNEKKDLEEKFKSLRYREHS